jgi:hypothetical protein
MGVKLIKSSSYNLVILAMYNGRKGDRPPVGNPTSIVCHGLMDTAGVSFPDAHLDAKMAKETGWKSYLKKLNIL